MRPEQFPVNVVLRTHQQLFQQVLGVVDGQANPVRWLICNAYPELDDKAQFCRVVVCFTDCSALKQAELASSRI